MNKNDWQWKFGQAGETVVRGWLEREQFWVLPASLIESGGAPMVSRWLENRRQKIVLPDNLAFKPGDQRWVEVKTKTQYVPYKGYRRTGIDLPHWRDYLKIQQESGIPGWLAFIHHDLRRILLADLDRLEVTCQEVPRPLPKFPHGAAFFDIERFDEYAMNDEDFTLIDEQLPQEARVGNMPAYAKAKQTSMSEKQQRLF